MNCCKAMKNTIMVFILGLVVAVKGQGFVNLNFERAGNPSNQATTNLIPGWTAYLNGISQTYVGYDDVSLGAGAVWLYDTNSGTGYATPQGKYFVYLQGGYKNGGSPAIGQTGTIPVGSQSIYFWGVDGDMTITFNGFLLAFFKYNSTPNYDIWAADVSAYAGQTGELRFTAPDGNAFNDGNPFGANGLIDNIQFSSSPVPEPQAAVLGVLGVLLFLLRRMFHASCKLMD